MIPEFLQAIIIHTRLDSVPCDQVYHVGFLNSDGSIYHTISITDSAVLCRVGYDYKTGNDIYSWYTYTVKSDWNRFYPGAKYQAISEIIDYVTK